MSTADRTVSPEQARSQACSVTAQVLTQVLTDPDSDLSEKSRRQLQIVVRAQNGAAARALELHEKHAGRS